MPSMDIVGFSKHRDEFFCGIYRSVTDYVAKRDPNMAKKFFINFVSGTSVDLDQGYVGPKKPLVRLGIRIFADEASEVELIEAALREFKPSTYEVHFVSQWVKSFDRSLIVAATKKSSS